MSWLNENKNRKLVGILAILVVLGIGLYALKGRKGAEEAPDQATEGETTQPGAVETAPEGEEPVAGGEQKPGAATSDSSTSKVDERTGAPGAATPGTIPGQTIGQQEPGKAKTDEKGKAQAVDSKAVQGSNQAGAPVTGVPGGQGAQTSAQQAAPPPRPPCKTASFQLKITKQTDMESAVHIVKLPEALSRIKGLCVRVGGDPVSFQKVKDKTDELIIRRVMEETKEIVASWCEAGRPCKIDCKAKKDEFMAALAGNESPEEIQGELLKGDGWGDAKSAENDRKLAKEMSELADALRELQKQKGLRIPVWTKASEQDGCEVMAKK